MGCFTATFRVTASPEEALAYLADYAHTADWDPGTVRCTLDGTGPIEVGTTWTNVSEFRGNETTLTYRLVSRTDQSVRFEGEGPGATTYDDFTVGEAHAGGTRVDYEAAITLKGWRKVAEPFLRGTYERMGMGAVEGLTKALGKAT